MCARQSVLKPYFQAFCTSSFDWTQCHSSIRSFTVCKWPMWEVSTSMYVCWWWW